MFIRAPAGQQAKEEEDMDQDEEGGGMADDDAKTVTTDGDAGEQLAVQANGGKKKEQLPPVALKFLEAKCQVPVPPEVIDIEVDPDIWGDSLEKKAAVRKTRKFHAVVLVDAEDKVFEPRTKAVKFEIFKGGEKVEEIRCPRAHKDFIFWFSTHDFLLPGLYTLRYTMEPFDREIKPLCLRVEVRARRAPTTVASVLNGHLSFLNVSRGGRYSLRQSVELDIPEEADEVVGLRIALLQLKDTLPYGALLEGPQDLVGTEGTVGSEGGPEGGPVKPPACYWTDALQAQWVNHLMEASTAQEVMEGLLLLESCLHPGWLKPWFHPLRRAYAATSTHLLRVGTTAAAAAFHLFVLDKALLYDKEKKVPRQTRGAMGGRGQQKEAAAGGGGGFRRSTNRSRLSELSEEEEEDDFEGADEETESEEEDEEVSDDEDGGKRTRARKAGAAKPGKKSSSSRAVKHPQRSSFRKKAVVSYNEKADNDIFDEESSDEEEGGGGGGREEAFEKKCLGVLRQLKSNGSSGPFLQDVPRDDPDCPAYYDVVPEPVSLATLEARVKEGVYGGSMAKFVEDVQKLWENALLYNGEKHSVTRMAYRLKSVFESWQRRMAS